MSKSKPRNWNLVLASPILIAALLFPSVAAATEVTPSPEPSVSVSPSESPSPEPTPTPEPTTPVFDIDSASSLQVVVNKQRQLKPKKYVPALDQSLPLAPPAAKAYRKLKKAVTAAGLGTLCLNSGYRSYATQKDTHAYQINRGKQYGYDGETVAARPGYSEHQTGLAADISITTLGCSITNFGATGASKWITKNAWQFGFVIRYPKNMQATTGYIWEPWHLRFVGVPLATDMKLKKIKTLEEYFGLGAAPSYLAAIK